MDTIEISKETFEQVALSITDNKGVRELIGMNETYAIIFLATIMAELESKLFDGVSSEFSEKKPFKFVEEHKIGKFSYAIGKDSSNKLPGYRVMVFDEEESFRANSKLFPSITSAYRWIIDYAPTNF